MNPALLTEHEASKYLHLSVSMLRRERSTQKRNLGIPFVKIGVVVRYSVAALDEWINSRSTQPPEPITEPLPAPQNEVVRGRGRPKKMQQYQQEQKK